MNRRILAVFVALVLATVGTAAVLLYVKRADDRAIADATPVKVLVASKRIPAGTTGEAIRTGKLAEPMRMPAGTLPEGGQALTSLPAELDKLVITSDLEAGRLMLRTMFGQAARTSGGLAIPDGKLAVSFEATVAEQVAGYVRPGSQVAIFVNYRLMDGRKGKSAEGDKGGDNVKGTAVLLPSVEVITIGPYGEDGDTSSSAASNPVNGAQATGQSDKKVLVTVAVDNATEAAKVIHVAAGSALWLALLGDGAEVGAGQGVDSTDFLPPVT
jgi:pilus assembly protein CpaB